MDWRESVTNRVMQQPAESPQPRWDGYIPNCDYGCRYYDGKRCELIGAKPDQLCRPVVGTMGYWLEEIEQAAIEDSERDGDVG